MTVGKYIMAEENFRTISGEDKIFGMGKIKYSVLINWLRR